MIRRSNRSERLRRLVRGSRLLVAAEADGDQLNILRVFKGTVDEISGGFNWYLTSTVKYAADVNVYRQKDTATVGGAPPQTFVVVLQRMQFRF